MTVQREEKQNREPVHPGRIVSDYMDDKGWTQTELAEIIGVSRPHLNEIINGKRGISPNLALKLSEVFDTSARFWMDLHSKRQLWEAQNKNENELDTVRDRLELYRDKVSGIKRNKTLLPTPDELEEDVKEVLDNVYDGLSEIRNFGLHVIEKYSQTEGGDEKVGIGMLLRRSVELIDSIAIQLREGAVDPSKTDIRVLLETTFYLKFIFQDHTKNRSLSLRYWRLIELKDYYMRRDSSHQVGKQFYGEMSNDDIFGDYSDELADEYHGSSKEIINKIENELDKPVFEEVRNEYNRLNNDRKPKWFEAFKGVNSIEQVAQSVGMAGIYNQFYRKYSDTIHSTDVYSGVKEGEDGKAHITQIRHLEDLPKVSLLTANIGYITYKSIFNNELHNEYKEFISWAKEDFRIILQYLTKLNQNFEVKE